MSKLFESLCYNQRFLVKITAASVNSIEIVRLETKSSRILLLNYVTKYDLT